MRDFRPGCLFELLLLFVVFALVLVALPYGVRHDRPHPGTLDPILNHQGIAR